MNLEIFNPQQQEFRPMTTTTTPTPPPAFCSMFVGASVCFVANVSETPFRPPVFIPNAVQSAILKALNGKALRSTALASAVGDRARLFRKPGGIQELRDNGLVDWHTRIGFYRPDAPPATVPRPKR